MAAVAMIGGDVTIENVVVDHLKPISAKLREVGVEISEELSDVRVQSEGKLKAVDIKTHLAGLSNGYAGQLTSLMTMAKGTSMIVETIFKTGLCTFPS